MIKYRSQKLESELCEKLRIIHLILYTNLTHFPPTAKILYSMLEEIYSNTINHNEMTIDNHLENQEKCDTYLRTYSLEWSYIKTISGKEHAIDNWFKLCSCKNCKLFRLLYKGLVSKQSTTTKWYLVNILIRLNFHQRFYKLINQYFSFLVNNINIICLRCNYPIQSFKRFIIVMRTYKILAKVKNQLIELCAWIPLTVSAIYRDCKINKIELINIGNLGLMIATNRFNYLSYYRFIPYARQWVKWKILQRIIEKVKELNYIKNVSLVSQNKYLMGLEKTSFGKLLSYNESMKLLSHENITTKNFNQNINRLSKLNNYLKSIDLTDYHTLKRLIFLSPIEERIIRLKLSPENPSLSEIGRSIRLSKEQVKQLILIAIEKMKTMQESGIINSSYSNNIF